MVVIDFNDFGLLFLAEYMEYSYSSILCLFIKTVQLTLIYSIPPLSIPKNHQKECKR